MTTHPHILGVILAGGGSRRMFAGEPEGGDTLIKDTSIKDTSIRDTSIRDKALVDLAGLPMLAHVIGRFAPQVGRLLINANGDPARFNSFGLEVIADSLPQDAPSHRDSEDGTSGHGPLAGLLAAMEWAARSSPQATVIATVTTDVPFLPLDLVQKLAAAGRPDQIVLAQSDGYLHSTIGLWPLNLAEDLEATLRRGERRAKTFAERHGAIAVSFPISSICGRGIDPFFNANTPDDVKAARELLTGRT